MATSSQDLWQLALEAAAAYLQSGGENPYGFSIEELAADLFGTVSAETGGGQEYAPDPFGVDAEALVNALAGLSGGGGYGSGGGYVTLPPEYSETMEGIAHTEGELMNRLLVEIEAARQLQEADAAAQAIKDAQSRNAALDIAKTRERGLTERLMAELTSGLTIEQTQQEGMTQRLLQSLASQKLISELQISGDLRRTEVGAAASIAVAGLQQAGETSRTLQALGARKQMAQAAAKQEKEEALAKQNAMRAFAVFDLIGRNPVTNVMLTPVAQ